MSGAVGSPEVNQLVNVILNASNAKDGVGDQGGSHTANLKTIRSCTCVDVVCGLPTSPRCHILHDDSRISRNMFAKKRINSPCPKVRCSSGRTTQNNSDCFVLIKRGLGESDLMAKSEIGKEKEQNGYNLFHVLILLSSAEFGREPGF